MSFFDNCGPRKGSWLLVGAVLAALLVLLVIFVVAGAPAVGIQAQLTDAATTVLADGSPVLFNVVLNNTDPAAITYDPATGVFTINQPGTYLVTWWLSVTGAGASPFVRVSAVLNGGTSFPADTPQITDQLDGTALITVTSAPATISIVNQTGDVVFIGATPEQGNVTINKI